MVLLGLGAPDRFELNDAGRYRVETPLSTQRAAPTGRHPGFPGRGRELQQFFSIFSGGSLTKSCTLEALNDQPEGARGLFGGSPAGPEPGGEIALQNRYRY